jgi:hypothetical protein
MSTWVVGMNLRLGSMVVVVVVGSFCLGFRLALVGSIVELQLGRSPGVCRTLRLTIPG